MSKKLRNEFRKRIEANKVMAEKKNNDIKKKIDYNSVGSYYIHIENKNDYISTKEVNLALTDILTYKKKFNAGEKINLSEVCDVVYNLEIIKNVNNKLFLKVC